MPVNISSSVSYTLGAAEDNLTLTGTANINGVGNALVNIINGNSGANLIKDTLIYSPTAGSKAADLRTSAH